MKRISLFAAAALLLAGAQLHAQTTTKQDTTKKKPPASTAKAKTRSGCEAGRRQVGAEGHHGPQGDQEEVVWQEDREEGHDDHQEAVTQAASRSPQFTQYRASSASTGAPHAAHLSCKYRPQFEQ